MKKLMIILMPITIIIALFAFQLDKNYTWLTFLQGLNETEFTTINWEKVKELFDILQFNEISVNLTEYWNEVKELFSFLYAIGMTIVSLGQYLVEVFKVIWIILEIITIIATWIFGNLYQLIKFIFTYIIVN